jgi:hypothetical protein
MGQIRNAYKTLAGKFEGKRPLGIPRCKSQGNIKVDLKEGVDQWRALMNK